MLDMQHVSRVANVPYQAFANEAEQPVDEQPRHDAQRPEDSKTGDSEHHKADVHHGF